MSPRGADDVLPGNTHTQSDANPICNEDNVICIKPIDPRKKALRRQPQNERHRKWVVVVAKHTQWPHTQMSFSLYLRMETIGIDANDRTYTSHVHRDRQVHKEYTTHACFIRILLSFVHDAGAVETRQRRWRTRTSKSI